MKRLAVTWTLVALLALGGTGWVGAGAESTATPPSGSDALTATDYEATIEALQTHVAELDQRIAILSDNPETRGRSRDDGTEESGGEIQVYAIGEPVEVNTWSFVVDEAQLLSTLEMSYETLEARGVYLLVYLTITNSGNAPSNVPFDDLFVKAANGRLYGYDSDATFSVQYEDYDFGFYDDLQPDLPYETVVAYDIPANATGLKVQAEDPSPWAVDLGI